MGSRVILGYVYTVGNDQVRVVKHFYFLKCLQTVWCPCNECLQMHMGCSMIPQCMDTACAGQVRVSNPVSSLFLCVEPSDSSIQPQVVRDHSPTLPLCCGALGFKDLKWYFNNYCSCLTHCWHQILHKKQHQRKALFWLMFWGSCPSWQGMQCVGGVGVASTLR